MTALQITLGTVGGIVGLALAAWPVAIAYEVGKCEKPKYTLLRTLKTRRTWLGKTVPKAELRLYAPYLAAEVTLRGSDIAMRDALSAGFRSIAGFIFGKNVVAEGEGSTKVAMTSPVTLEMPQAPLQQSTKIAMTSPVTAEMDAAAGEMRVSFIMPSKYTLDTLPRPVNPDVHIKEMPARCMAALTWNGASPREAEVESRAAELRALLESAGLRPKGSVHVWQFDPPFQWRWFRTNEVLFEVEGGAEAVGAAASS